MKTILIFFCIVAVASSYRVFLPNTRLASMRSGLVRPLRMAEETSHHDKDSTVVALVPLEKTNMENAAAVTGGVLGFVLGGPVFALLLAAVTNYATKKENDSGEALRGVGKTVVESYNFLNKLNAKYQLTNKVGSALDNVISSAASDSDSLDGVKKAYKTTVEKLETLNKEYDLVNKGKEVIVAAATLSDAAIEKAIELNEKVS